MRVDFASRAVFQLRELRDHIARESGAARAERYIGRIVTFCEGLTTFPERGRARDDLATGMRVIGFERRVTIAFVPKPDVVLIALVLYAGQEIETAMRDNG